jgi:hypothetical protein
LVIAARRIVALIALLAISAAASASEPQQSPWHDTSKPALEDIFTAQACCKRCNKGKPCGDSCIPQTSTCKKGKGCAC